MSFKTISIIIISVLVTIILMNNTDEIDFWIFGDSRIPKLAVLGAMFGLGLIMGFLAGRPRKKAPLTPYEDELTHTNPQQDSRHETNLSDEDREYIS